jgi:hypothetical protein
MNDTKAFAPFYKVGAGANSGTLVPSVTVTASAGAASASDALPPQNSGGSALQIANQATTAWAYINFGKHGSVDAATVAASYPVAPGAVVVVSVDQEVTGASIILSAGSSNVVLTRGNGV